MEKDIAADMNAKGLSGTEIVQLALQCSQYYATK
jgi:hypothetical protein